MSSTRRGVERVEVLGERLPLPVDALVQRGAGDVLDAFHQLDEEVVAAGPHRREPDAAVAHHHGGHAVPARRRHLGIPGDLAVVVRVHVDPARGDDEPVAVELLAPAPVDRAHLGDLLAVDGQVAGERRRPRAVDDRCPSHHKFVHGE